MVHGTGALAASEKTFRRAHVDHRAKFVAAGPVAHDMALAPLGLEAERGGQHFGGRFVCPDHEGDAAKAAQRMLGRHVAVGPAGDLIGAFHRDEG
jgi:hypothetical protein